MLNLVLNVYISSICMGIGIFGNVFMLSILFRWLIKYHVNLNFGQGNNRIHRASAFNFKSRPRQGITINRNNVLNYAMCIFLVFFSMSDLGFLLAALIGTFLSQFSSCASGSTILLMDLVNAFKGNFEVKESIGFIFRFKGFI